MAALMLLICVHGELVPPRRGDAPVLGGRRISSAVRIVVLGSDPHTDEEEPGVVFISTRGRSVWFQPSAAGEEAHGAQVQHMSSSETQVNPPSDVCSQEPDDAEGLQLLLKGTFSACWDQEPETSLIGTDASPGWAEASINNQISRLSNSASKMVSV